MRVQRCGPTLSDERVGLSRSFVHRNQEISVARGCCPPAVELKKVVRSGWLVAPGGWCPEVRLDPIHLAAVQQGPRRCIGCRLAWPTKMPSNGQVSLAAGRDSTRASQVRLLLCRLWWCIGRHGLLR